MFSKQVNTLDVLDPQWVDQLWYLLGNCQAELEHRGQVKILASRQENATDAVLELSLIHI